MKNKSHERTILFEKYYDSELKGDDLINFEFQLKTDKDFAEDYFLQKIIMETLERNDIFDLRDKLDKIRKDFKNKKKS
ncbi:MAG: hypothetical protein HY951_14290 [Bacteroidia bacterium]|nr:hypothetical protein [Bacteroidia bacterium]